MGQSRDSYSFDGKNRLKHNSEAEAYGEYWAVGDTIGCHIDLQKREMAFSRNGRTLGVAFKNLSVGEVGDSER